MGEVFRRSAIPVIAFVVGLGFQVSGFQDNGLSIALLSGATIYGVIALVTWPPVRRYLPIPDYEIQFSLRQRNRQVRIRTEEDLKQFVQSVVGPMLRDLERKIAQSGAATGYSAYRVDIDNGKEDSIYLIGPETELGMLDPCLRGLSPTWTQLARSFAGPIGQSFIHPGWFGGKGPPRG